MNPSASPISKTLAFVMAGGLGTRLRPLTDLTPKPLLPFGGDCCLLDFTLSNCANSNVPATAVLSQYKAERFERHLRRVWRAEMANHRLFHLHPVRGRHYQGTADAVRQSLDLAVKSGVRQVLILSADHVYWADYRELVDFHQRAGADVTVSAVRVPQSQSRHFGILEMDRNGAVTGFQEKPMSVRTSTDDGTVLASMGVYVFETGLLAETLRGGDGRLMDFGRDVLPHLLGRCSMAAWTFQSAGGGGSYWRDLGTLDAYFQAHQDLLDRRSGAKLFPSSWPIATPIGTSRNPCKARDREVDPPGESVISGGCRIEGRLSRSVLSPGVCIAQAADVQETVLLHGARVGAGARLRRAVVGPGVCIPPGASIGFDAGADRRRFHVTAGGVAVIDTNKAFRTDDVMEPVRLPGQPTGIRAVAGRRGGAPVSSPRVMMEETRNG